MLPQVEGKERVTGSTQRLMGHRHTGPPQNFQVMERGCTCTRAGWEGGGGETEGRLPRDCALGAWPREDKLAAVTERPIKALGLDSGGKKVLEEMKEQSRLSVCPYRVSHYLFCMTNRHKTIPEQHRALDTTRGTEEGRSPGCGGEAGGWVSWLCTRWHKRCTYSSSWKFVSLESGVLGLGVFYCSLSSLCWVSWLERLAWATPHSYSHLGLHVSGEVQCVPLQFCEGNGGVLQVVQEDLDL